MTEFEFSTRQARNQIFEILDKRVQSLRNQVVDQFIEQFARDLVELAASFGLELEEYFDNSQQQTVIKVVVKNGSRTSGEA